MKKWILLLAGILAGPVCGDDIEVFDNPGITGGKPNVLFVLDTSGSMDEATPSNPSRTKLESLREAVERVLTSSGIDINAGYVNFGRWRGNGIKFPVASIDAEAHDLDASIPPGTSVREALINMVRSDHAVGKTPTVDALYEAALYFRGDKLQWGRDGNFGHWNTGSTPPHYTGGNWKAANPASYTGTKSVINRPVPLDTPLGNGVSERWCDDDSISGGTNHCASIPSEYLDCKVIPAEPCTDQQVDVCNSPGWTYPVVSACLNGPGSSGGTWFNSNHHKCCQRADATNTECLSWKNLAYCENPGTETQCVGGHDEYKECRWLREYHNQDDRRYTSPISQCGANMIVLLSDGAPSKNSTDTGRKWNNGRARGPYRIRDLIARGLNAVKTDASAPNLTRHDIDCEDLSESIFNQSPGSYLYGNCGPELAHFLSTVDQIPGVPGSTVKTYTIGFGLTGTGATESQNYLRRIAEAGKGFFGEADSTDSLVRAMKAAIAAESANTRTFTGIVTSVDRKRLSHNEDVYLALFRASATRAWAGNIKGYTIGRDGLEGLDGNLAVDDSGELTSGVRSYWSLTADGNDIASGGAVARLIPADRNIYVNTSPNIPAGGIDLTSSEMLSSNTSLTRTLMGLPDSATDAERDNLIDWARSQRMHDPLHAKPIVIDYGGSIGKILYAATNQGYLHAIDVNTSDTSGGVEKFAFMPYHLIGNLRAMAVNSDTGNHIYGIDGTLSAWFNDANKDGEISGSGEHVYLYFGLRRGGKHFYALDVTDPESPRLKWRIDAGSTHFEHLGQSWSKMTLLTLDDNGSPHKVLVFTGGYDTAEDTVNTARSADTEGLGVYIVDAETGAFIASIGPNHSDYTVGAANMIYSIPSGVRAIDSDGNHFADRLYFGDMGGQLWRVDIAEGADLKTAGAYTVTRLADFGGATSSTHRRFYYPPSVARLKRQDDSLALAISIGSGYRAHPLNRTINDRFYTVFDTQPAVGAPSGWTTLSETDLYDATANLIGQGSDKKAELAKLAAKSGWRLSLSVTGEKVLAEARSIGGTVYFTTFEPSLSSCGASGVNRLYAVSLKDGTPPSDLDGDGDTLLEDRVLTLGQGGIAPEFKRIFLPCSGEGCTQDCVGTECRDGPARLLKNIFWREER